MSIYDQQNRKSLSIFYFRLSKNLSQVRVWVTDNLT